MYGARGFSRASPASVSLRPLAQASFPLARLVVLVDAVDGPRELVRPVGIADRRGLVDAIAPAEGVLNRQQQQVGSRREERLDERERRAHRIGHDAEILGDEFRAGAAKQIHQPLALRELRRLVARREESVAALFHLSVRAVEADEMIDAVAVVQIRAAARALAQ